MTGVFDLRDLLRKMTPSISDEAFVYCTFNDFELPPGVDPICTFREAEGLTVITSKAKAEAARLPFAFPCRLITLAVHSSLEAVGFLACITHRLASAGIACNTVAAFHHDHLFVPEARAEEAMLLLRALASEAEAS